MVARPARLIPAALQFVANPAAATGRLAYTAAALNNLHSMQ